MKETDFLTEYEELAKELAMAARQDAIAFGDKIDALKALTPFYVQKMKNMKPVPDGDDLPTFGDFSRDIHAMEN
jgi:hypothetical protein